MPETYYKSTVTKNSIGDITSEMTLEDILSVCLLPRLS